MQNLIPALIQAKKQFQPIKKDGYNPYHKSKYSTLDSILSAVESALLAQGLFVTQTTKVMENGKTVLLTTIYHTSGESLSSEYPLPENLDSQKLGAAITYARRYALCAILSVAADEEDEAQRKPQKTTEVVWDGDKIIEAPTQKPTIDLSDIIAQTTVEVKRLGWTNEQGKDYLLQTYGKRSRQLLTDKELLDFLKRLKAMVVEEKFEEVKHSNIRELKKDMIQ